MPPRKKTVVGYQNTNNMHPFVKMAGLKSEKEFLKKYKSEDAFFSEFPQARNGYTFNDPNNPYQPIGGTLDYNGVQPTQLPQNARGTDAVRYMSDNIQDYQPSAYQSQAQSPNTGNAGAAQASNWIGQAANTATSVIDGIGSFWKNIQVAAPQLLNALIPDNEPRRVNRPLIAENQYAYGTGSQMMYENGGMVDRQTATTISAQEAKRREQQGIPYMVSDTVTSQPMNPLYPQNTLYPLPSPDNYYNPRFMAWQDTPQMNPTTTPQAEQQGTIPLLIQEYVYDDNGRNTLQTRDVETLYFKDNNEKLKYLKDRQKDKGYGLFFGADTTKTTAIDTRASNPRYMKNGGSMYEKGKDYTLSQQELKMLKDLGYEVEIY